MAACAPSEVVLTSTLSAAESPATGLILPRSATGIAKSRKERAMAVATVDGLEEARKPRHILSKPAQTNKNKKEH